MKYNKIVTSAALVLGLLATTTACAQSSEAEAETQTSTITGAWTMQTLEAGTEGDLQEVPHSGQIIFTDSGNVSVQAMNPDRSAPDTDYTVQGYEAFYGPVDVDQDAGTFTVEVESAAARDLIGQRLTRNFDVSDDTLTLTPTDPSEGWRVTYERSE